MPRVRVRRRERGRLRDSLVCDSRRTPAARPAAVSPAAFTPCVAARRARSPGNDARSEESLGRRVASASAAGAPVVVGLEGIGIVHLFENGSGGWPNGGTVDFDFRSLLRIPKFVKR